MEPYKIYDFEDEKAWLKGRLNGIGGSDASAVVGKNPYKCDACGIGITCEKEDVTNIQVGMNELGNFVECPSCGENIRVTEYTEQIQKRSIK